MLRNEAATTAHIRIPEQSSDVYYCCWSEIWDSVYGCFWLDGDMILFGKKQFQITTFEWYGCGGGYCFLPKDDSNYMHGVPSAFNFKLSNVTMVAYSSVNRISIIVEVLLIYSHLIVLCWSNSDVSP